MEDRTGARANLAKAAAAFTVLSLLPVALSGSAPSHASSALRHLYFASGSADAMPIESVPWPTVLFASFDYERGEVSGTYVQFAFDATTGTVKSVLGVKADAPVLYVGSIEIEEFPPARSVGAVGPIFRAQGYLATITAHDDPTILLEIRSQMARSVTIELPASASNVSVHTAPGTWPASSVSFSVGGGEQARFLLGAGTFNVTGTELLAHMADSDLLLFKAIPAEATNKAEWRVVLDAITAGQVGAELDLVATPDGRWVQNAAQYRIDLSAWAVEVHRGKASIRVESLRPGGMVVLLAFDAATMPVGATMHLAVRANGGEVNRTNDTLTLLYAAETPARGASYAVLPFPGTFVALYLPSLASISVDVVSLPKDPPAPVFDTGSEAAMIAALALVSVAAARMLRRRQE